MNAARYSLIVITTVCILCAGCIARADETTNATVSITIRECVERALQNNFDIRVQRVNPTIQSWGIVSAQSIYDPTLSGSVSYQDSTTPLAPEQEASLHISSLQQQN